ncbi:MAG: VWA domain-containing protein [Anaerolineales bacterium]|nr:VWA domain-containing protein [Anaerolineales bacterium]MBP6209126.1 VWA domain-containing protein [Anaerolineales bacterium]
MSFIWPALLWSLVAVPLLVWLYLRMQKRRAQFAVRYGSLGLVQQASGGSSESRRHVPAMFFLAGLIVLFVALGRPQMLIGLPKVEGIVILAFDVSGSMSADDFEPTRMEAAKIVAKDFVARQPTTVRVGVVAFSDSGFSVQLPTNDQASIVSAIDRLQPQRGTSLANGIVVSLNTIANVTGQDPIVGIDAETPVEGQPVPAPVSAENSAVIVLLTDGENNMDPDPFAAAQFAAERDIPIHTIALGSTEGTILNVNGFTVHTKVDEAALQEISGMTEGLYFNAENEEDLQAIYESIEPNFRVSREKTEVTAVFAGLGILLLLVGGMMSLLWFGRLP